MLNSPVAIALTGPVCAPVAPVDSFAVYAGAAPIWFSAYEDLIGVSFTGGEQVAIAPFLGTTRLAVYMQIARGVWARMRYDIDTDPAVAMSRRAVHVFPSLALYRAKDMTQTGAWNAPTTTSTTGSNQRHVGNTAVGTSTAGRKLTQSIVPLDAQPYNVWAAFTQRTAGGFCKPYIDGAQTLLDPSVVDPQSLGFDAFSCYGSVDNTRRILVKLATGLTGTHTIDLECVAGVPTGSSAVGTGSVTIEAILCTSELDDPRVMPVHWAEGQAIVAGDEREYGGRFYCATTSGTTSATPPEHTSGNVSDGGVTWSAAGYIYASGWIDVRDIDYSSEVESAIVTLVFSGSTYDVGGQTHGNEFASNRAFAIDGAPYALTDAAVLTFGSEITINEDISWKTASGGTTFATGTRETIIAPNAISNNKTVEATGAFTIAAAYGGMLPSVRWDGFWRANVFTQLTLADGTQYDFDDYPTNTAQALGEVYSAAVSGDLGICGDFAYAVRVPSASVNNYDVALANAFCNMNINAVTPPPSGATDWQTKLYFARANATAESISIGQQLVFANDHRFGATP